MRRVGRFRFLAPLRQADQRQIIEMHASGFGAQPDVFGDVGCTLPLGQQVLGESPPPPSPEVTEQVRRDVDRHEKLSAVLRASVERDKDELWGTADE
jgi:hypothetical protein